jgi:hypothetical protein
MIYGMRSSYYLHQKNQIKTIGRPVIPFRKVLDDEEALVYQANLLNCKVSAYPSYTEYHFT